MRVGSVVIIIGLLWCVISYYRNKPRPLLQAEVAQVGRPLFASGASDRLTGAVENFYRSGIVCPPPSTLVTASCYFREHGGVFYAFSDSGRVLAYSLDGEMWGTWQGVPPLAMIEEDGVWYLVSE